MRNEESSKLMFEALHFMQDLRRGRIKDYEERLMDSDLVAREKLRRYISRRRASIARSEDFKRQLLSTLRSESTAPAPEALPGVRIVDVRDEENPAPDAATPEITSNHVELSLLPHALQVAVEHGAFHDVFEKHLQKILDSLPGPLDTRILAAQRLLPLLESKISRVNKLHTHDASPRTKARLDRLRQTRERLEAYIELLKHPEDSSGLQRDTSLVKRESISSIVLHSIDDLRRSIDVGYLQQLTEKTTADQRHVLWEKVLRRMDMHIKRSKRIGPHSELRKDMENLEAIRKWISSMQDEPGFPKTVLQTKRPVNRFTGLSYATVAEEIQAVQEWRKETERQRLEDLKSRCETPAADCGKNAPDQRIRSGRRYISVLKNELAAAHLKFLRTEISADDTTSAQSQTSDDKQELRVFWDVPRDTHSGLPVTPAFVPYSTLHYIFEALSTCSSKPCLNLVGFIAPRSWKRKTGPLLRMFPSWRL
jgi:hypothetical protein